ncbi:unnamed protein product [Orchesella dallaii]|uniref:Uncharacterized protein n=1 Tax=Orchesella dallaii TaxID=48710 RepID=A0ABP1PXA7_9HEXA
MEDVYDLSPHGDRGCVSYTLGFGRPITTWKSKWVVHHPGDTSRFHNGQMSLYTCPILNVLHYHTLFNNNSMESTRYGDMNSHHWYQGMGDLLDHSLLKGRTRLDHHGWD